MLYREILEGHDQSHTPIGNGAHDTEVNEGGVLDRPRPIALLSCHIRQEVSPVTHLSVSL
jgi:hypothetical protein